MEICFACGFASTFSHMLHLSSLYFYSWIATHLISNQTAAEEGVTIFCLPPHTTHLTQTLDKGCFGPLKAYWREECWSFSCANPDCVITQYRFSQLFTNAWLKGMTTQNIVGGFRITGLYPINRSILAPPKASKRMDSLLRELACHSYHCTVQLVLSLPRLL